MGKIFLIRHGETSWTLENRLQGQKNPKLTQKGKKQAQKIAQYLKRYVNVDLIYSSTLVRSYQTAKIIGKYFKKPVFPKKELVEMSFGELEGKLESEVNKEIKKYLKDKANYQFPAGENYDLVIKRIKKIAKKILSDSQKINVLIVGHQAVNRVLLGLLLNLPKEIFVHIDHPHNFIYEITEQVEIYCHNLNNKEIKKLKIKLKC